MVTFNAMLEESAKAHNSLLCVGLDPRTRTASEAREECLRLIDATADYAAVFKPNSAYFEAFGAEGWGILREVVAHVPPGTPVLLDAKRGDFAPSSEAYARAVFDQLGVHALTVHPYLGADGGAPFWARPERGAFVLCRTSNPDSDEFQELRVEGRPLFEVVAEHVQRWNTHDNIGLVVGATYPEALARVRVLAPQLWILVPGIGAQGGDLKASLEAGLRADGMGLILNASRAIAQATDPRNAARQLRDEINQIRDQRQTPLQRTQTPNRKPEDGVLSELARDLLAIGCVKFGQFTLKSGLTSPIYIDLRLLVSQPAVLKRVARAFAMLMQSLKFDRIAGIPMAGLPIATAVGLEMERAVIYPRPETKSHGLKASVEGAYQAGETAVAVDDLVTTGGAKIEAIKKLEEVGLRVRDVVVLIERGKEARQMLRAAGYQLHAVVNLNDLLPEWLRMGALTQTQLDDVQAFLQK